MPSSINWPPSLPQNATVRGYGESLGVNLLRTPMDAGPAKLRRVGNRPDILSLGYLMSTAQVATLETFVKTTIAGVKRYNLTHPRTGVSKEVRIVPEDSGDLFKVSYVGPNLWQVDLQVEVLP